MSFDLAPMTAGLRALSWILFALPAALFVIALRNPATWALFVFVCLAYASVWLLFRPTRFELDSDSLRIVWPLRSRTIGRKEIAGARLVSAGDFGREYGRGMRIGAGGLWGGFGLLKTDRATFSMWISRLDPLVIVELRGARPLLVTPENPEKFVTELSRR